MRKTLTIIAFTYFFAGCGGGNINYDKAATQSGVEADTLKRLCDGITCNYDTLKDRIEATANDAQNVLWAAGNETRTIEFSWASKSESINIDVFDVFLYGSWRFDEYAEIYVGKEMVFKVAGPVDRVVGKYNDVVREHEQIERISSQIDLKIARKIAEANYKDVTIRFYGKEGYKDKELPRRHSLIKVVKLAELGI